MKSRDEKGSHIVSPTIDMTTTKGETVLTTVAAVKSGG